MGRKEIDWTVEQEKEILSLYYEGSSALEIATRFGVSRTTILKKLRSKKVLIRTNGSHYERDLTCYVCKINLTDQNYPNYIKITGSKSCKDCFLLKSKERQQNLKYKTLSHYSKGNPVCVKCGFTDLRALSLDHINGDGNKHRKSVISNFYRWVKQNNYPNDLQVLCMNCQFIKRSENKELRKGYRI